MRYNKGDTPFHRAAKRIQAAAQPLLDDLDCMSALSHVTSSAGAGPSGTSENAAAAGDLEPSRLLLQTLLTADPGEDPSRDYLASVFAFQIERPKAPTPPPPTRPQKQPRKAQTAAERRQRWEEKQAAAKERATTGRSTRATHAMSRAFAKEAGVTPSSEAEVSGRSTEASSEPIAHTRISRRNMRNGMPSTIPEENLSTTDSFPSAPRRQRGVVGLEAVTVLSDRQRRAQERGLDISTEQLDPHDQFPRFNVGWILPTGAKRRRSERPPEPVSSRTPFCTSRNPARLVLTRRQLKSKMLRPRDGQSLHHHHPQGRNHRRNFQLFR